MGETAVRQLWPSLSAESDLLQAGYNYIAGLDEAGRGAWAGPVAAAAVILPLDVPDLRERLRGVRDSKMCTPRQRDALYDVICRVAVAWAVALVPPQRIDEVGIVPATREAMRRAVARLVPAPNALLIDALRLPALSLPQRAIKKGDRKSLSIASASILAKVARDRVMVALDEIYPGYGFARHKGYGTPQHRQAIRALGVLSIHRQSFAPIARMSGKLHISA